jgi:hypothetical protein
MTGPIFTDVSDVAEVADARFHEQPVLAEVVR